MDVNFNSIIFNLRRLLSEWAFTNLQLGYLFTALKNIEKLCLAF